ncbi:hypothetical protein LDI01_12350 [Lentilactobacillus diolivorans]|uniref:BspA family leucine-rich repeat surface protein n=1 Tax=Lentilactobacillus diolivorans TaxID=179838 RepID=A0ABQ0XC80_9LACO|nr:hypothetical protein LDI01_12350 [Lentilactobacillus diolivorans]
MHMVNCQITKSYKWLFVCVGVLAISGGMAVPSVNVSASQVDNPVVRSTKASPDDEATFDWGSSTCTVSGDTLTIGPGTLTPADPAKGGQSPIADHPEAYNVTKIIVEKGAQLPQDSSFLFATLINIKSIEFQNIDTATVTNMANLFSNDTNLNEIKGLNHLNTENVTTMANMFDSDSGLTALDLGNFNTAKVKDMSGMFTYNSGLKTLDVSKFDTENVTNMKDMFVGTQSLTGLDVSNFNTKNVTNMGGMFMAMKNLESSKFKGYENFDTSKVTNLNSMFSNSIKLTKIDLSKYDTSQVTTMYGLFFMPGYDGALQKIDLSGNFNTKNVTNFDGMLQGLPNLWELKLSPNTLLHPDVYLTDPTGTSSNPKPFYDVDTPGFTFQNTGQNWRGIGNGGVHHPTGNKYQAADLVNLYTMANPSKPTTDKTYVWEQNGIEAGKITVKYVDQNGQQIHDPQTVTGFVDDVFDVNNPTYKLSINGYTLDETKLPKNIIFGRDVQVVTFVYTENSGSGSTGSSGSTIGTTTPATPIGPSTPVRPETPSTEPDKPTTPTYVATKGTVIYAIKKIGLYKSTGFSTANRLTWYAKKPRIDRPMFVVTGYKRSADGVLRYQVRDVNHLAKAAGKTGYVTASQKYVKPVYYANKYSTITVINPRGVNAYRNANLTNKVKNYRQGIVLRVKRIVKHNLTTRYVLANGNYVTANRKLVNMGRHQQVKSVKTKRSINRYRNVNLTKKSRAIAKNKILKVYGYDYSNANNHTKRGVLRYRVAGGFITANPKYVHVYK